MYYHYTGNDTVELNRCTHGSTSPSTKISIPLCVIKKKKKIEY